MPLSHLNPYVPGAGHPPPHLAGRTQAIRDFQKVLNQVRVVDNVILTGLRGVGKTVLLDQRFKVAAIEAGWIWVGSDFSESASVTEEKLATRLLTDLAVATEQLVADERETFWQLTAEPKKVRLTSTVLGAAYRRIGGLVSDKLKAVFEAAWFTAKELAPKRGIIFAYDEAQNMGDNAKSSEYPLSVLLEVFVSLQKKGLPFMLVLTGLPTLFPRLVEARTYAERMFTTIFLDRLTKGESREAITKPLDGSQVNFAEPLINEILEYSGGYPYFIQFICRETFDVVLQRLTARGKSALVQIDAGALVEKLDRDFFQGRWAKLNDRQRDIITIIAHLPNASSEFSVREVVDHEPIVGIKKFSPSHATQILNNLATHGIVYRNRYGKYCFAVPLMAEFVRRQEAINGR